MKKVYVLGASPNNAFVPQFVTLNDYMGDGWLEKAQATAIRFLTGHYLAVVMYNGWHNSGISQIEYILARCLELPIEWLDISKKGLKNCPRDLEKIILNGRKMSGEFDKFASINEILSAIEMFGNDHEAGHLEWIAYHAHNINRLNNPDLEAD